MPKKSNALYTFAKHDGGTFHIPKRVFDSEEYKSLNLGARCLLNEFQRIFHPSTNGRLNLCHAQAMKRLNASDRTVSKYYAELMQKGFIAQTLDYSYSTGKARLYRITYEPCKGHEPTDEWKK